MLRDGQQVPLAPDGDQFVGTLAVAGDTAYRVRLRDADGLENAEDPEYFVRRLDDRPPDVRIIRPAGDKRVTPLEEVTIEARADDDHGLDRLELVVGVRGAKERAVSLGSGGLSVTGRHTVYLEDLDVKPGDFVSFYARARDVGRGKRPTESRSDIFFLEVTPFVDEFAMAQSQAMAGAAGQQVDDLVQQQKDIIVGTWKLQRRAGRRQRGAVGRRREDAGPGAGRAAPPRRNRRAPVADAGAAGRRGRPGAVIGGTEDEQPALLPAARAMARAEQALDAVKPNDALPSEMEALNHLLRAEAEIQRREIARQQANSSGGGSNRNQQDLSSLFDRELQRQQETNYETPQSVEERKTDVRDELLEKVRALARRQEALARQQDDLARDRQQMDPGGGQAPARAADARPVRAAPAGRAARAADAAAGAARAQRGRAAGPVEGQPGESGQQAGKQAAGARASRRGRAAPRPARRRCARRPRTCALRPANCGASRLTPRASAASVRSTVCNRSSAACARRALTNNAGPPETRSSRPGSWPIASGSWRTKPRGPAPPRVTMLDDGSRVSSSGWPSVPMRSTSASSASHKATRVIARLARAAGRGRACARTRQHRPADARHRRGRAQRRCEGRRR